MSSCSAGKEKKDTLLEFRTSHPYESITPVEPTRLKSKEVRIKPCS
jgi:hypothetical protein